MVRHWKAFRAAHRRSESRRLTAGDIIYGAWLSLRDVACDNVKAQRQKKTRRVKCHSLTRSFYIFQKLIQSSPIRNTETRREELNAIVYTNRGNTFISWQSEAEQEKNSEKNNI